MLDQVIFTNLLEIIEDMCSYQWTLILVWSLFMFINHFSPSFDVSLFWCPLLSVFQLSVVLAWFGGKASHCRCDVISSGCYCSVVQPLPQNQAFHVLCRNWQKCRRERKFMFVLKLLRVCMKCSLLRDWVHKNYSVLPILQECTHRPQKILLNDLSNISYL